MSSLALTSPKKRSCSEKSHGRSEVQDCAHLRTYFIRLHFNTSQSPGSFVTLERCTLSQIDTHGWTCAFWIAGDQKMGLYWRDHRRSDGVQHLHALFFTSLVLMLDVLPHLLQSKETTIFSKEPQGCLLVNRILQPGSDHQLVLLRLLDFFWPGTVIQIQLR